MSTVMLKTHYSAAELAALSLSCIQGTERGVQIAAKRDGWESKKRSGRGGGYEYALTSLPLEAQEEIRRRAAHQALAVSEARGRLPTTAQLPLVETAAQSLTADARRGVLQAIELLMQRSGYSFKKAASVLLDMARIGQCHEQIINALRAARDRRGHQSPDGLPSVRSLIRFVEYEQAGKLAPRYREKDMAVPAWAGLFLSFYQQPQKPTQEHAYRQFCIAYAEQMPQEPLPSFWQARRFLKKLGNVTLEIGRMGDRELKTLKPFIRRGFESLLPGDIYSADGHAFDAEVQHPLHGRPFRPEITTVVDIATRRAVGWSVGLSESALAVLDALRNAVQVGGIPAIFYVDNGSGYKNQMMMAEGIGLMGRLGVEMVNSLPYNSQARGVIERLHQTIWVQAAKELAGYMGADMDRQAKQNVFKLSRAALKSGQASAMPLMNWAMFVRFCEDRIAAYNNRPHRSLPKTTDQETGRTRHMTPNEMQAKHMAAGWAPHLVSDDEARPLFRPQEVRVVRRCEIELFGNRYFASTLEEFHGDQLRIGYDIHDPQHVWVYDQDGRFICTADLDGNKRDYMPQSFIERAKDKRANARVKRAEAKIEEIEAERRGMPALEVAESLTLPGFMTVTKEQLNQHAIQITVVEPEEQPVQLIAPVAQAVAKVTPLPETPAQRWERCKRWEADLTAGVALTAEETQRYALYIQSQEYKSMKSLEEQNAALARGVSQTQAV